MIRHAEIMREKQAKADASKTWHLILTFEGLSLRLSFLIFYLSSKNFHNDLQFIIDLSNNPSIVVFNILISNKPSYNSSQKL